MFISCSDDIFIKPLTQSCDILVLNFVFISFNFEIIHSTLQLVMGNVTDSFKTKNKLEKKLTSFAKQKCLNSSLVLVSNMSN